MYLKGYSFFFLRHFASLGIQYENRVTLLDEGVGLEVDMKRGQEGYRNREKRGEKFRRRVVSNGSNLIFFDYFIIARCVMSFVIHEKTIPPSSVSIDAP